MKRFVIVFSPINTF